MICVKGLLRLTRAKCLSLNIWRGIRMELADIRHELENAAKKLAEFRGSL